MLGRDLILYPNYECKVAAFTMPHTLCSALCVLPDFDPWTANYHAFVPSQLLSRLSTRDLLIRLTPNCHL